MVGMASVAAFEIKKGDRLPELEATLKAGSGAVLTATDLSAVTGVKFLMRNHAETKTINAAATVVGDGTTGEVSYAWADGDTDTPDLYEAEFQVTYIDGRKQTFPNEGHFAVRVVDDLGD